MFLLVNEDVNAFFKTLREFLSIYLNIRGVLSFSHLYITWRLILRVLNCKTNFKLQLGANFSQEAKIINTKGQKRII